MDRIYPQSLVDRTLKDTKIGKIGSLVRLVHFGRQLEAIGLLVFFSLVDLLEACVSQQDGIQIEDSLQTPQYHITVYNIGGLKRGEGLAETPMMLRGASLSVRLHRRRNLKRNNAHY